MPSSPAAALVVFNRMTSAKRGGGLRKEPGLDMIDDDPRIWPKERVFE